VLRTEPFRQRRDAVSATTEYTASIDAHELDPAGLAALGTSADAKEAITAFLEKRPAQFTDRVSRDMPGFVPWWTEPAVPEAVTDWPVHQSRFRQLCLTDKSQYRKARACLFEQAGRVSWTMPQCSVGRERARTTLLSPQIP
jgi:hypothetical protein